MARSASTKKSTAAAKTSRASSPSTRAAASSTKVARSAAPGWSGHPVAATALRVVVYAVPFVLSVAAAFVLSLVVPPAPNLVLAVLRIGAIAAVTTVVMRVVDTVMRRLLPLATLLDLTLMFPDQAPSRLKVALRASSATELEALLKRYRETGANEPAQAAERLLELVGALSQHDRLTRGHSERVRAYTQMIGKEMGLSGKELDQLRWGGLIHDIGKLLIPGEILNKTSRLTAEEFEVIKQHPDLGFELAKPLAGWLGDGVLAVSQHHEKWDGSGYPRGLRGTEISLAARIVAVADVFDVMTSARSYKKARPASEARIELARCAGSHFDPAVVRAFLALSLGGLRRVMGPLSFFAQFTLFPQSALAQSTGGSSSGGAAASGGSTSSGVASSAASSASAGSAVSTASVASTAAAGTASSVASASAAGSSFLAGIASATSSVGASLGTAAGFSAIAGVAATSVGSIVSAAPMVERAPTDVVRNVAPAAVLTVDDTPVAIDAPVVVELELPDPEVDEPGPEVATEAVEESAEPDETTTTITTTPITEPPATTAAPTTLPPAPAPTVAAPTTTVAPWWSSTPKIPASSGTPVVKPLPPETATTTVPPKVTTTTVPPKATTTTTVPPKATTTTTVPPKATTTTTTTVPPTATTTTTVPPTTTTTTTTTVPPTTTTTTTTSTTTTSTTTTSTTTTTTLPDGSGTRSFYLSSETYGEPTDVIGDTNRAEYLGLAPAPRNAEIVNHDKDVDDLPGRLLRRLGLFETPSVASVQKWVFDSPERFEIDGAISLTLYIGSTEPTTFITTKVQIRKCRDDGSYCSTFLTQTVTFSSPMSGFREVELETRPDQPINSVFASSERLEVWVSAEYGSNADVVIAYDSLETPASLTIDFDD